MIVFQYSSLLNLYLLVHLKPGVIGDFLASSLRVCMNFKGVEAIELLNLETVWVLNYVYSGIPICS